MLAGEARANFASAAALSCAGASVDLAFERNSVQFKKFVGKNRNEPRRELRKSRPQGIGQWRAELDQPKGARGFHKIAKIGC